MEIDSENQDHSIIRKCKFGVLSRLDGSALFCEGQTAVLAAVYGPVEVKMQKVLIEKASVECFYRPKAGLPGVHHKFHESIIRNISETAVAAALYPRTAILINLQEMQNRGQLISCSINAACLACLDAGIDMKFLFGAVSCFLSKDKSFSFTVPLNEDETKALFVFVFNNTTGSVLASHTEGSFSVQQYKGALSLCREESKHVFSYFKKELLVSEKK